MVAVRLFQGVAGILLAALGHQQSAAFQVGQGVRLGEMRVPEAEIPPRVDEMVRRFGLGEALDAMPNNLPLGIRQRLSLAVAMVHKPELLILDEPTSGVDPIARDSLWQLMIDLARHDQVTIFISTHFMNEAARCDRISLMHAGRVLVTDVPAELVRQRSATTLEQAFISYLEDAGASGAATAAGKVQAAQPPATPAALPARRLPFSLGRAWSYSLRETLELRRDPVRATMALLGTAILMFVFGYGISLDVENLTYAVLDRDQTTLSQNYALNLSGSRYFVEHPPIADYAELDRRMRAGELALAIEIPPGFARDVQRGTPVQIAAWVDGAMPRRAETVQGYVQGMHQGWLLDMATHRLGQQATAGSTRIETRFRYNPDVKSLPAMVPAVIPMLLLMVPAMLAANYIILDAPAEQINAIGHVAGGDVAFAGLGPADQVATGAAFRADAVVVGDSVGAGAIDTDIVADDRVAVGVADPDADMLIAGNDVALGRRDTADGIVVGTADEFDAVVVAGGGGGVRVNADVVASNPVVMRTGAEDFDAIEKFLDAETGDGDVGGIDQDEGILHGVMIAT